MRLVRSSVPGAVERDETIRLLSERAVLTRMVCRELMDSADPADRRPHAALFVLLSWIAANRAESSPIEAQANEGLDRIIPPEGYADLLAEIKAGAEVCRTLFLLFTADNRLQAAQDRDAIQTRLSNYWTQYPHSIRVPR